MAQIAGGSVVWTLDANPTQFNAAIDRARDKADDFGNQLKKTDFKTFASGASSAFNGIANSIAGMVKTLAFATVGAGGIGTVFIKSAADVEKTAKSFEVLTGSAEVAGKLFAQLFEFAQKTPFEFPDIAKAGKTLLGFGISSDQVFGKIKQLGDIAAATGADFGSLAVVYGQVNATGRLMGQDALQLINNNLPITTILAKKLGVSVQEVKAQMEKGAISADIFNEALKSTTEQGGFAFGGTAKLAETFSGRMSTLKDTVLEFGRNLIGVFVNTDPTKGPLGLTIKPGGLFDQLTQALPKIGQALQDIGPKIQAGFSFLIAHGKEIGAILVGVAAAFTFAKVAAIGFFIAANIANPFFWITVAIGALAALQVKFNIFGKTFEALKPVLQIVGGVFKDLWKSVGELATVLGKQLAPVFEFVSKHAEVFKKIGLVLLGTVLIPIITPIAALVAGLKLLSVIIGFVAHHFEGIKKILMVTLAVAFAPLLVILAPIILLIKNWGKIMKWFGNIFESIGKTVSKWAETIGDVVTTVFNGILKVIKVVMTTIWNIIKVPLELIKNIFIIVFGSILLIVLTVLEGLKNMIVNAFNFYFNIIKTVMGFIWNVVTTVWNAVFGFISGIMTSIWNFLTIAWNTVFNIVSGALNALWGFISGIWNQIYQAITGVVQSIINFFAPAFNWLFQKGKDIVNGLVNGIKNVAGNVWNAIRDVSAQIGNFFSGAWNWLYDTGRSIVEGLVRGIRDMINKVREVAGDIGNAVKDKVKNLLGIRSPSKVFHALGMNVTEGFIQGIDSGIGKVEDMASSLTAGTISPTISGDGEEFGGGSRQTNNVSVKVDVSGIMARSRADMRDVGVDIVESINEGLRAKGLPEIGAGNLLGVKSNG